MPHFDSICSYEKSTPRDFSLVILILGTGTPTLGLRHDGPGRAGVDASGASLPEGQQSA